VIKGLQSADRHKISYIRRSGWFHSRVLLSSHALLTTRLTNMQTSLSKCNQKWSKNQVIGCCICIGALKLRGFESDAAVKCVTQIILFKAGSLPV
jgi:hypothetical protein